MKPRNTGLVCIAAMMFLLVAVPPGLRADWMDAAMREHYTSELDRARAALAAATQEQEAAKGEVASRQAQLEEERSAAKKELAAAKERLVSALAEAKPVALEAAQAEIDAHEAALDAVETEKSLIQRRLAEAGREADAWRKRVTNLELGLRLEAKALLAAPAEIAARDKMVESSRKEVANQGGQVRKYATRRFQAEQDWMEYVGRIEAAEQRLQRGAVAAESDETTQRLAAAQELRLQNLRRGQELQGQRVLFNKTVEDRAWRSLAFARTDLEISQVYAAALAARGALIAVDEADASAAEADAAVDAGRNAVEARLKVAGKEVAAASAALEKAQKAVVQAPDAPGRTAATAAQTAAIDGKARWEAQADFLKEYLALQRAMSAFAREKADKAATAAEVKTVDAILNQMPGLRESAKTSELYVASFKSQMDSLDGQIETGRTALGLDAERANRLFGAIGQAVAKFAKKESAAPQRVEEYLNELAGKVAAGNSGVSPDDARRTVAMQVLLRVSQRALLKERLTIAAEWLANTRSFIAELEQRAARKLWERRDPRLQRDSVAELAQLGGRVWNDLHFLQQAYRTRIASAAGYAGVFSLVCSVIGIVVLGALTALLARRLAARAPDAVGRWFLKRTVPPAVVLLLLAMVCRTAFAENRFASLMAYAACSAAVWWALRSLLQAGCAGRKFPSGERLSGAFLADCRMLLATAAVLIPVSAVSQAVELWSLGGALRRIWWFFVWLAVFRLALHPVLLGRFLSRKSESRGLRLLGGALAWGCVLAAILAVIPYLLSLESLGRMVLRISEATLVTVCVASVLCGVTGWVLSRSPGGQAGAGVGRLVVRRLIQGAIVLAVVVADGTLWRGLLRDVFLSPNAPAPVQKIGVFGVKSWEYLGAVWHKSLTGGMTVESLCKGLIVFALSFWIAKLVKRVFMERVLAKTPMDDSTRQTFGTVLGYLIIVVGFLVGLNVAGSSLQNLALLAGAITVGLGFGLQNVINNFVSSLMIHFGRAIRVGDYIEAGGFRGTVQEIGLRSTRIFTDDGITVLVPNGTFVSSNIINWTNPSRSVRLHVPLSILRTVDMNAAIEAVTTVALAHPLVQRKPAPIVETRSVTADRINLELLAWTNKPTLLPTIVGELSLSTDKALRDKGYC